MPSPCSGAVFIVVFAMVIVKHITLLHNPSAGDEAHDKKHLKQLLDENGYDCRYASTKDIGWKAAVDADDTDLLLIAGGDGTVRKVTKRLLQRKLIDKLPPLALLPMGTANNIAKTVCADEDAGDIVAALADAQPTPFDIGRIGNVPEHEFFIESFGFGVFPYLMMEMKKRKIESDDPEEELKLARELLLELTHKYEAKECKLTIDGEDHSGKFILAEILNIKSIGPNLYLAPDADAGDGLFDVVLIPEEDKRLF
ncbi:MAG TPA: diacylglycerol kinase family protein, partial [Chitinophagales bacterium]|nr:diacylglycerol kinase family protein [Chitinophagales bacterium]